MAKRITLLALFGLLFWQSSVACDACGCSISGNGMGMLTAFRNNFIGIGWQQTSFHGDPNHGDGAKDYLHTVELSVRYHFTDRLKVLLNQPFRINQRSIEGETRSISGISDTRIVASYTFLNRKKIGKNARIFFELGGGLKLPVGKYDADLHETDLPENFNIGNGSWGYIVQPNLVLNHKNTGLVIGGLYQYFGKTSEGYRFGSQLSTQVLAFHSFKLSEKIKLLPNAGLNAEWITEDRFANEKTVTGTGGQGVFATAGINLKSNNFIMGVAYAQPISQDYSHGEVTAKGRISCQFSYIF